MIEHSPVLDETETDVAIVGSGIAGLTLAFQLEELGLRSIVFELGTCPLPSDGPSRPTASQRRTIILIAATSISTYSARLAAAQMFGEVGARRFEHATFTGRIWRTTQSGRSKERVCPILYGCLTGSSGKRGRKGHSRGFIAGRGQPTPGNKGFWFVTAGSSNTALGKPAGKERSHPRVNGHYSHRLRNELRGDGGCARSNRKPNFACPRALFCPGRRFSTQRTPFVGQ